MANIIKKYILSVYDDGKIITDEITADNCKVMESIELIIDSKGSSRIKQILYVIENVKSNNQGEVSDRVSFAIKEAANAFSVNTSSIIDKLTRQLSLNIDSFNNILNEYLNNGNDELYKIISSNVGAHTRIDDQRLIDLILDI
ncbi:hypothetical protein [Clostridium algidicarnis]|uniref:Uncharacterized protein n=1 Tax=Clostridium algidicarnis TaxID=37659 RepID=A0ABS6C582_9CLOT|nr:hypothetical protein [Clostridium algidicarnis]MBU3220646.1 hypothetical protein [Clostridium algidicarnis]